MATTTTTRRKLPFLRVYLLSFSSGRKDTDDIFVRDIDVFNCERLVPADLFGELPYWESCDVFVREGTLSVVDKPAGSVHHLEPRVPNWPEREEPETR